MGSGYFIKGFADQLNQGLMGNRESKLARERFEYDKGRDVVSDTREKTKHDWEQKIFDQKQLEFAKELESRKAVEQYQKNQILSGLMSKGYDSWQQPFIQGQDSAVVDLMTKTAASNEQSKYLGGEGNFRQAAPAEILTTRARGDHAQQQRNFTKQTEQAKDLKQKQAALITGLQLKFSKEEAGVFAQAGLSPSEIISIHKNLKETNGTLTGKVKEYYEIHGRVPTMPELQSFIAKTSAPDQLTKLILKRNELPEGHPDKEAYERKISGIDIDIEDMTPEEIDTWGAYINLTGKVPSVGRGKEATKTRIAMLKSAARQSLGENGADKKTPVDAALEVVATQADTKSIQTSLNFLDKQMSSMGSFVVNLNAQVDRVKELSKDLMTFDIRLLNVPLRAIRGRLLGSPLQAKYDLYLAEIESEIGKLATGSTGSVAELSVGAQERWERIHDKNLSIKDMLQLLEETKNAANYRIGSVKNELNNSRNRMRTREYVNTGDQEQKEITATNPQTGEVLILRNGIWEKK